MYAEDIVPIVGMSVVGLMLVVLIGLPIFSIFWGPQIPGDGEHSGYVTATENGGILWKTNRAYFKTDNQSSQEDIYCVKDAEVLSQLRKYQEAGTRVNITYSGKLFVPKSECRNEAATITAVKEIGQ